MLQISCDLFNSPERLEKFHNLIQGKRYVRQTDSQTYTEAGRQADIH